MRASGKDGRKIYCDEEELAYLKQCLKLRRDGKASNTSDTDCNTEIYTRLEEIQTSIYDLFHEVERLQRAVSDIAAVVVQ